MTPLPVEMVAMNGHPCESQAGVENLPGVSVPGEGMEEGRESGLRRERL